jgi:predicted RNase H-like HicB family nuclease
VDPDVPDRQPFSAFGDAPTEALAEIEQAIEAWLAVARRRPADPEAPMPCTALAPPADVTKRI